MGVRQARTGTLSRAVLVLMGALLLTAVAIAANFTNYGSLIPRLESALHIGSGEAGLFSTVLYGGIACTYLPGGMLADRTGSHRVLIGSLLLIGLGGCLLPLSENLVWMLLCRALIGLGSGAAIVAGSQAAARLGRYAAFGQGLYGGAMQVGAGLGLFLTPQLLVHVSWQQTFVCWGAFALFVCLIWHATIPEERRSVPVPVPPRRLLAGWGTPAIWCLGLVHLGTLGIGQAIAPWLALYFAQTCGLPVPLAALLGSIGLFAGMLFRPLGGALLTRRVFSARSLLCLGTILTCVGVGLLALSIRFSSLVGVGIALLSFGTTFPYAAVLSESGRVGKLSGIGTGTAQGMVSVLSAPASSLGPPMIGLLLARAGGFSSAFGALALVGLLSIGAALLASIQVLPVTARSSKHDPARQREVHPGEAGPFVSSSQEQDRWLQGRIARLLSRQKPQFPATVRPLIAVFDSSSHAPGHEQHTEKADSTVAQHLLEAGGLPVLLPVPAHGLQAGVGDVAVDEDHFQRSFEQVIWPLFSDLLFHRVSGLYLGGNLQESRSFPYKARQHALGQRLVSAPAEEQWSKQIEHALGLLAWLVGIPVLEGGPQWHPLQARGRRGRPAAAVTTGTKHQGESSLPDRDVVSPSAIASFVADCSASAPPPLESLQPLQAEIYRWLYRREQERLWKGHSIQAIASQKTGGQTGRRNVPAESLQATRLKKRQRKLSAIRTMPVS
jgi:cyanate permease